MLTGPWSYSRAMECARAHYLGRVLKAPPEPRPERFTDIDRRALGSVLHEVVAKILSELAEGRQWPDVAPLVKLVVGKKEEDKYPYAHLASAIPEIEARLEKFRALFRTDEETDADERDEVVRQQIVGSELRLAMTSDGRPCDYDSCPADGWRGVVDYAEYDGQTLTIIDFKNRPAIYTEVELRANEQLSCYMTLFLAHYPKKENTSLRFGIYYLEYGHTQIIDVTPEQVAENMARLRSRAEIKSAMTDPVPEPGFGRCQYCDYLASCPAGQRFVDGGLLAPMDMSQALDSARWLMVNEERIKAVKAGLRAFTAEFGPVALDEQTSLGYSLSVGGVVYDKNLALRVIKKMTEEKKAPGTLADYVSLNLTEIKKAAKRAEVDDALACARSPKIKPEFDFFRPLTHEGVVPGDKPTSRQTKARVKGGGAK